jgi:hypothetical protein
VRCNGFQSSRKVLKKLAARDVSLQLGLGAQLLRRALSQLSHHALRDQASVMPTCVGCPFVVTAMPTKAFLAPDHCQWQAIRLDNERSRDSGARDALHRGEAANNVLCPPCHFGP